MLRFDGVMEYGQVSHGHRVDKSFKKVVYIFLGVQMASWKDSHLK